jgi:glycosyltransferase involved in cell wall biosynthesis
VQGEDIFLEELVEPYRSRVRETLRERARDVDGFVATSRYYADYMTGYLGLPADRMHHVRLGIRLDGHGGDRARDPGAPFTVGYLARICPEKGLHVLIDAFRALVERDHGRHDLRLRIAGWLGKRDRRYFDGCMERARAQGLGGRIEHVGEVDRQGKIDFLRSLDVLSVPTVYREPKGLYILEALANGVPVVQPSHGAFPELIAETGGGVLVTPESAEAVAAGLYDLMVDEARRAALGRRGREVVHALYGDARMAQATLDLYRRYTRETH